MPMTNRSIYRCYAFSLVELAMVLLLVGLMLGAALSLNQSTSDDDCITATKLQLRDVDGAIQRFARANDRLPMPASRTVGVESTTYGREASGGAIDTAGSTSWGALPFQALGLAPSYASDCWGNKLTYVVTTALTTSAAPGGYLDHAALGTISVLKDASTNSTSIAGYAVISHGEDALGAVKNNYSGAAKGWCTGAVTLATQNCLASAPTVANAVFNNGKDAGTAYFDDIVIAGGRMLSVNGKCDNSVALGCTTGSVSNDNGQTACGTTRTWHCDGANGGTNDTGCSLANPACGGGCAAGWGAEYPETSEAILPDCNQTANNVGWCAPGPGGQQGGHDLNSQGLDYICYTRVTGGGPCTAYARDCGCLANGDNSTSAAQPGGNAQRCCSGSIDGAGICISAMVPAAEANFGDTTNGCLQPIPSLAPSTPYTIESGIVTRNPGLPNEVRYKYTADFPGWSDGGTTWYAEYPDNMGTIYVSGDISQMPTAIEVSDLCLNNPSGGTWTTTVIKATGVYSIVHHN